MFLEILYSRNGRKHDTIWSKLCWHATVVICTRRDSFCFRSPIASGHAKQCWCSVKVGPNSLTVEIWSRITHVYCINYDINWYYVMFWYYIYIDLYCICIIIYSLYTLYYFILYLSYLLQYMHIYFWIFLDQHTCYLGSGIQKCSNRTINAIGCSWEKHNEESHPSFRIKTLSILAT